MTRTEQTESEGKVTFRKFGARAPYNYAVLVDGVRVGSVRPAWRKLYGGDCWTVVDPQDGETVWFTTRRAAAAYLVHRTEGLR